MGLINSINQIKYIKEEEQTEKAKKQNEKIIKSNLKLQLQQIFYNKFKENYDIKKIYNYFNLLENRNVIIFELCKNNDAFTPYINNIYSKELNFIYNIFKNNQNALEEETEKPPDYTDFLYDNIKKQYQKHGVKVYYSLSDYKEKILNSYNINNYKYSKIFDKINKDFYKEYKEQTSCLTFKNIFLTITTGLITGIILEFKKKR